MWLTAIGTLIFLIGAGICFYAAYRTYKTL